MQMLAMRIYLSFLFLLFWGYPTFASSKTDSLLNVLKKELLKKKVYDNQKEARIKGIRNILTNTSQTDYVKRYNLCSRLYEEYKVYQFDSAYVYTKKLF